MTDKREEAARLREELSSIQAQLKIIEESMARTSIQRIEEIRAQIKELIEEAKACSQDAGITFYPNTFIEGIEYGGTYGDEPYWAQSQYC